jgi:hypothetical protein
MYRGCPDMSLRKASYDEDKNKFDRPIFLFLFQPFSLKRIISLILAAIVFLILAWLVFEIADNPKSNPIALSPAFYLGQTLSSLNSI